MVKDKVSRKRKIYISLMRMVMILSTALTTTLILFLLGYVLIKGIPGITWELLSTKPNYLTGRIGILPDILNTIYVVLASHSQGFRPLFMALLACCSFRIILEQVFLQEL